MPSQVLCVWCGKTVDVLTVDGTTRSGPMVCQSCSDWQKARGSDEEDHVDPEGLGAMRAAPGRVDAKPRQT